MAAILESMDERRGKEVSHFVWHLPNLEFANRLRSSPPYANRGEHAKGAI